MSEEKQKLNLFGLFGQVQESYQEAEAKAKSEQGAPKIERFRTGEDGKYQIRVLPLAPVVDEKGNVLPMDRKGYEYPLRQLFLDIQVPGKGSKGKPKMINVPVIQATQKGVGKSIDLIDTYVKIAKELYADDQEVLDLIASNSYSHGLKWNSLRCMYVIDLDHRNKGPMLYQPSYSQYRDMDDAKLDLWNELLEDNKEQPCPISAFKGAYPVTINRKNNNGKTEYKFSISTVKSSSKYDLTEEELQKLFDLPRINEVVYRYTKYQLEATKVFLEQYDERHELEVTKEKGFEDAYKQLLGELPKDDTSSFDIAKAGKESKDGDDGKSGELTFDDLCDRYDNIVDQDLSSDSDEYQELRADIAKFAKDNGYDLRVSHSKTNSDLLDELEDLINDAETVPSNGKKVNKELEPEPEDESDPEPDPEPKEAKKADEEGGRRRTRRARPSNDDDKAVEESAPGSKPSGEPENNEETVSVEVPEEGRRRRRERRPR